LPGGLRSKSPKRSTASTALSGYHFYSGGCPFGLACVPVGVLQSCAWSALHLFKVGFLFAVLVRKTSTALTTSLFAWLLLVFIGDLGVMGAAIVTQMPIKTVFWIATLNPLQMFKMAAILNIQANLEVLGPVGLYATETYGTAMMLMLILGLLLWIVIPLGFAQFVFGTRSFTTAKRSPA
jgi:Cu-processing system permease protein